MCIRDSNNSVQRAKNRGNIIMKNKTIKKVIASCLLGLAILSTNSIKANAEWRKDTSGWWYTEGTSYSKGWRKIEGKWYYFYSNGYICLLYTSPSPRDLSTSRMPSSA
eukprot:TRINITY_DN29756_c0_g1_i6.p3 TRINITY_DN29756_c0_g1~~TRINITY_DN29756_c0_g1_i6.p3  ORF type:complete len:108 (-),score=13.07 TRINITY_DN29756_c0_g1_i6:23-346(-)